MNVTCYDCAAPIEAGTLVCPHCSGGTFTRGRARPTRAVVAPSWELKGPWSALGRWDAGGVVALAGAPGAGKSTLAALLEPTLWLTCEQTAGQAAGMLARVIPGDGLPEILAFGAHEAAHVVPAELGALPHGLVVVDSLTAAASLDGQVELLQHVVRWARGGDRRALVILGMTSADTAAGRRQLRHAVDAFAVVAGDDDGNRRLAVEKNRFGPLQSSYFTLGAGGAASATFPYSYSVEGRAGAYTLVPFPSSDARWDGPLRARCGDTAETGWACAARIVPGYPNDRLVPADVGERRRFAEAHGLRWLEG